MHYELPGCSADNQARAHNAALGTVEGYGTLGMADEDVESLYESIRTYDF